MRPLSFVSLSRCCQGGMQRRNDSERTSERGPPLSGPHHAPAHDCSVLATNRGSYPARCSAHATLLRRNRWAWGPVWRLRYSPMRSGMDVALTLHRDFPPPGCVPPRPRSAGTSVPFDREFKRGNGNARIREESHHLKTGVIEWHGSSHIREESHQVPTG